MQDKTEVGICAGNIYAQFESHPGYPKVRARFINSMLLKCAQRDKVLAREVLGQLPLRYWNSKTFRAIGRFIMSSPAR